MRFRIAGFVADLLGMSIDLLADVLLNLANLGFVQPNKVSGLLITDLAVFEIDRKAGAATLVELAAGVDLAELRAKTGAKFDGRAARR